MKRRTLLFGIIIVISFALFACGGNEKPKPSEETDTKTNTEMLTDPEKEKIKEEEKATDKKKKDKKEKDGSWENQIERIASSEGSPSDKLSELESFMIHYKASSKEVEQFKDDIISEYEEKRYLADLKNNKYMLTMIFKTYVVEQNEQGTPLGDFAFNMHQNLKYTYRGIDKANSESVKTNEERMNKALDQIKSSS